MKKLTKKLSKSDIDALCNELHNRDISYARNLDSVQNDFLKLNPPIKNWGNFKIVEEIKRLMLGLHDRSEIVIIDEEEINDAEKEVATRFKKIKRG